MDVSDWEGVAFWIKKGSDHPELEPTGYTLFFSLRDANTASDSVLCNDNATVDAQKCDAFGAAVNYLTDLTDSQDKCDASGTRVKPLDGNLPLFYCWRYVMIPFSEMKQRGYGVPEPALDKTAIRQVTFGLDIGNWNLWVDDVFVYRHK